MGNQVPASVIALLLICVVSAFGEGRRSNKDILVIMTLNGEWMWDGVKRHEVGADKAPVRTRSKTKSKAHMRDLVKLVKAATADTVNVVEV